MATASRRNRTHMRTTHSALVPPRTAIPPVDDIDAIGASLARDVVSGVAKLRARTMRQQVLIGLMTYADDDVAMIAADVVATTHARVFRGSAIYTSEDTPPPGFAGVSDERLALWVSEPIEKRYPQVTHAARRERHRRKAASSRRTTQFLPPPPTHI